MASVQYSKIASQIALKLTFSVGAYGASILVPAEDPQPSDPLPQIFFGHYYICNFTCVLVHF